MSPFEKAQIEKIQEQYGKVLYSWNQNLIGFLEHDLYKLIISLKDTCISKKITNTISCDQVFILKI